MYDLYVCMYGRMCVHVRMFGTQDLSESINKVEKTYSKRCAKNNIHMHILTCTGATLVCGEDLPTRWVALWPMSGKGCCSSG
jgi:hypothetical protein